MTCDASVKPPPKLSKEFANAVYDDWKRKAIDSAKKRAVAQFVDYDTFKNMVLVAHLKPIGEVCQTAETELLPAWCVGKDGRARAATGRQGATLSVAGLADQLPASSSDFERQWRRCSGTADQRYAFLRRFDPHQLAAVFKVEVKSTVLADVVTTLAECWLPCAGAREASAGAKEAPATVSATPSAPLVGLIPCPRGDGSTDPCCHADGASATRSEGEERAAAWTNNLSCHETCTTVGVSVTTAGGDELCASHDAIGGGLGEGDLSQRTEEAQLGADRCKPEGHAALREAAWVLQALQALATAGRFALSVRLLPGAAKTALQGLFADMLEAAACGQSVRSREERVLDETTIRHIANKYCILV